MSDSKNSPRGRSRVSKNTITTRSGNTIKVNRSITGRIRASRANRSRRRAGRLALLPKSRFKRVLYRLEPKHLAAYWFSREGLIMALKLTGIGIVAAFVILVGLFAYFRKDLPQITNISGSNLGGSITYYDRTGTTVLWQDYNAVKRVPVPGTNISNYVKQATVAIEDKNFYKEGGISVSGIVRAGLHDLSGGGSQSLQGASTLTQQVVKLNEDWNGQRGVATKIKEIILAVDLGREYSKSDILTAYLNIAPYGGIDYGVQSAAEDYFHVSAADLTLPQAALLAAIPQAPGAYSPYLSPEFNSSITGTNNFDETGLIGRQQYILQQMAKQGYVTNAQAIAAEKVNILSEVQPLQSKYSGIQDPYFVLAAKQQLENQYGSATVNRGGWKVITTLNVPLQNLANNLAAANLPNVVRNHGDEEAIVAEDIKTGQVAAMVGGSDFNQPDYGQINYAETQIPPGSSFKPYDYSTLINNTNNVGAGSMLYDVEEPLPGYPCTNKARPLQGGNCLMDYDFRFPGPLELRYALAGSRNIPAAKAMLSVIPNKQCEENIVAGCVPSINKVISTADAMMDVPNAYQCYSDVALTQPTQCYASSAFGDGAYLTLASHVNGLSTLARLGQAIPQTMILKITDSSNKVIYNWTQPTPVQVLKPDSAYIIDSILDDPNASYLPGSTKFQHYNGWDIAVKTGTTNNEYDALMTAWTTQYAVVSWAGYHSRNVALTAGLSEAVTEPMTRGWIEGALSMLNEKAVNWVQPSDIKVLPSFQQLTHIDYGDVEPGPSTDLYPSWYTGPAGGSSSKTTKSQTLDKVSGDVATACTPPLALQTVNTINASLFSVDLFYPIGIGSSSSSTIGTTTTTTDPIHNCADTKPTATLSGPASGTCIVGQPCSFTVTATQGTDPLYGGAYTTAPAGTVNFLVGSQIINTADLSATYCSGGVCNIPINYVPTSAGSLSPTVQVIDSVLYEGDASLATPVTVTAGP